MSPNQQDPIPFRRLAIGDHEISLPIWPGMTDAQVDRVASTLLEICDTARCPVDV